MKRRSFLKLIAVVFPVFVFSGCGGSKAKDLASEDVGGGENGGQSNDQDDPNEPAPSCAGDAGVTYTNPGHAHTTSPLTALELENAVPGEYSLLGGDHSHMIEITDQDFRDLKNGLTVVKMDSDRHGHNIVISC